MFKFFLPLVHRCVDPIPLLQSGVDIQQDSLEDVNLEANCTLSPCHTEFPEKSEYLMVAGRLVNDT